MDFGPDLTAPQKKKYNLKFQPREFDMDKEYDGKGFGYIKNKQYPGMQDIEYTDEQGNTQTTSKGWQSIPEAVRQREWEKYDAWKLQQEQAKAAAANAPAPTNTASPMAASTA